MMGNELLFANFWQKKKLLETSQLHFPVSRWWRTDGLCDIERIYFEAICNTHSILDVGAGDLRVKRKFQQAGYSGVYETQDIGTEFPHTYSSLDQVSRTYECILCFDLIEHMSLSSGITLMARLLDLLAPGGLLILQTPNARCIRNPMAFDMTHEHCYNLPDLWALLSSAGLETKGYRIVIDAPNRGPIARLRDFMMKLVVTRLLGCDYADNIGLIARKPLRNGSHSGP